MIYVWDVGECVSVCWRRSGSRGSRQTQQIQPNQDDDSGSHYDSQQECGKRLPDHFIFSSIFWVSIGGVGEWRSGGALLGSKIHTPHHTDTHAHQDSCIYHIIDSCMWQVKNFFHVAFSLLVSVVFFPLIFSLWFVWAASFRTTREITLGYQFLAGSPTSLFLCIFGVSFFLYFFWVSGFC